MLLSWLDIYNLLGVLAQCRSVNFFTQTCFIKKNKFEEISRHCNVKSLLKAKNGAVQITVKIKSFMRNQKCKIHQKTPTVGRCFRLN